MIQMEEGDDDEDTPFMDTATFSWRDTTTYFKYGKFILMFFHQLS
jgi:hypothetical protein